MTASDRDALARIIYTATRPAGWQDWEQTSDGMRAWCRAKADEAMAAGWRKVGDTSTVMARAAQHVLEGDGYSVAFEVNEGGTVSFCIVNVLLNEEDDAFGAIDYFVDPDGTSLSSDSEECLRLTDMCRAVRAALADPAGANGGE